ncbi:MAG: ABC transporter ATP-binding protein [Desulfomonilaceae bacterium]|nr:ABC transporter ATP-binding protein [Desulfomonilaceae bacterium]
MILKVADVEFSYNSHPVLQDVNFTVPRGSVVGVLGVNGAGKSTLLKCINRILKPNRGCVLIEDRDLSAMSRSEIATRIGYVPQRHGGDQLTVFDTVLLGRRPYIEWSAAKKDLEIVSRIIRVMRLEEMALRPVSQLSGGEAQKVVLARALAQEPDILLLDEPTSSLDLKNQLEVMGLIHGAVKNQGLAAIVTLHDLNLALRFADRFLFLKNGTIHSCCGRDGLCPETIRDVYDVDVIMAEMQGRSIVIPA